MVKPIRKGEQQAATKFRLREDVNRKGGGTPFPANARNPEKN